MCIFCCVHVLTLTRCKSIWFWTFHCCSCRLSLSSATGYKPSKLVPSSCVVVSIFLLVVWYFFCQLECMCALTWEFIYYSFLISAVTDYIYNLQCHLDCVCLVLFWFLHSFCNHTSYCISCNWSRMFHLFCLCSSHLLFCSVQFSHPYKHDGTAIILYNFNIGPYCLF